METVQVGGTKRPVATVVDEIEQREWWRAVCVRDIMTSPVICVDSVTTVTDAQILMKDHNIRRVPVIDEGTLVSILTQGDVRGALPSEVTTLNRAEQDYLIKQLKVERVMSRDVIVVTEEMSLLDAARLLVQYKIGGLPVLADGKVVGMVTESDIFGVVVAMFDKLDQI
ncbi:MAG: CBS domain-containing protein [Caldilineaceae bacterium]